MRADRLIAILLRLQARNGITAKELAGELEVSSRTIYRDIEALSMAGIPVYAQRGDNGGLFLDEHYKVSLTNLLLPEIQALFVMGGATPLEALNLDFAVENSLLKLLASLPSHYQLEATALQQRLYIDTQRWNQAQDDVPLLDVIQTAVWQDKVIKTLYQSQSEESKERQIAPYGLVVKAHIWYLLALPEGEDEIRVYRVSRFKKILITEKIFQRPATFKLKSEWQEKSSAFEDQMEADYAVQINLPAHLINALDYFIPNRYHIIETDEHTAIIEAQFYTAHEARSILMGFGNQVEIIEPHSLADSIYAYAQSIVEKYEGHKK